MNVRALLAAALVSAALCPADAQADVDAAMSAPNSWYFDITHMDDIDQRRDELPNNGSMYCVPASTMNLMAYFAKHGLPGLQPGVANWRADSLHGLLSFHLGNLGTAMQTSGTAGTTGDDAHDGTVAWLSGWPGYFTVSTQYQTNLWTPRYRDAAMQVITQGAYVTIGCGWYTGDVIINRGGGHRMTLVSGAASGSTAVAGFRDPATDDGDINEQSPYMTEQYGIEQRFLRPDWSNYFRSMDEIVDRASAPTRAIIDDYSVIRPTFALTTYPEINGQFALHQPWIPGGGVSGGGTWAPDPGFTFCEGVFGPDGQLILKVIPDENPAEHQLHIGRPMEPGSEWTAVDVGAPMTGFVDYTYGRHRSIYIYDENLGLLCYDFDADFISASAPPLPYSIDSISYAVETDEVVLLSIGFDRIIKFDRGLTTSVEYDMPPTGLEHGAQIEAFPPDRIKWFIWAPETSELWKVTLVEETGEAMVDFFGSFDDPVDAVAFGDGGLVLASINGSIAQFDASGNFLAFDHGPFSGLPAGTALTVARSTTNYDPAFHGGHDYNTLLTTTNGTVIPDCPADFDFDGSVTTLDLLEVLATWGTSDPYTDIAPDGGDETVAISDLLAVLAAWGGCP